MKELEQRGYAHITLLAKGGEGSVYICEKDSAKYIAKISARLTSEQLDVLKSIDALKNEYFPRVEEIIDDGESTIVVREYIVGTTLADEFKKSTSFSFKRAKEITFEVCNALRALHNMKPNPLIYRDLKPENIIMTPEGEVRLIDFGIARYYKEEAVRDTVLAGTKGYTAPEVMAGMQSNESSDVYSVGLLFYELLSGKSLQEPPYQIRPVAEYNEYLPEYIDGIIAKATDINQTNRYATIDAFVYEMENIKEIKATQKRKKIRNRLLAAVAMLLALTAAAFFFVSALFGEKVEMLLALDFNDVKDIAYINGYENSEGRFDVSDDVLHILRERCDLAYTPTRGMIVHIKIKSSGCGAVALGPFRINNSLGFECIYHDSQQDVDMTTWNQQLSGMPIVNTEQWIDCLLYVSEQNDAVYAVICDNESGNIAYTAYRIPEAVSDETLGVGLMSFFENDDDYMLIDSIDIVEGPLKQYLKENMLAYTKHQVKVDAFLAQEVFELPEMVFKPVDQWQKPKQAIALSIQIYQT